MYIVRRNNIRRSGDDVRWALAGRPATSAGFRQAGGDIRGGFDRQTDRQTDRVN